MAAVELRPLPLTRERFAPYGDVIESGSVAATMNDARFDRYDDLCGVDIEGGDVAISIARSRTPSELPYRVDVVERHPLGSQAFVPLSACRMIVVVAPPGESVDVADLRAFETNGRQGINYRRGTWHMPLIAFEPGQRYLVIDRKLDPSQPNCDIHSLDEPVMLIAGG